MEVELTKFINLDLPEPLFGLENEIVVVQGKFNDLMWPLFIHGLVSYRIDHMRVKHGSKAFIFVLSQSGGPSCEIIL
jgi:hypothetical protein